MQYKHTDNDGKQVGSKEKCQRRRNKHIGNPISHPWPIMPLLLSLLSSCHFPCHPFQPSPVPEVIGRGTKAQVLVLAPILCPRSNGGNNPMAAQRNDGTVHLMQIGNLLE